MKNNIKVITSKINHWPVWCREVMIGGISHHACSLDRLIYLWMHKLKISGTGELKLLGSLISPGNIVLDVGANIGLYSAHLSSLVGSAGNVHSFEPIPQLYACLKKTVEQNKLDNISTYQMALGDIDGSVIMEGQAFNSGDYRVAASDRGQDGISVPVRRGDHLLPAIKTVHVIKIDVQGYEIPALKGLSGIIESSRDIRIVFEYWPEGMSRAGYEAEKLVDLLRCNEMNPYVFDKNGVMSRTEWKDLDLHCIQRPWGRCGNFVAMR